METSTQSLHVGSVLILKGEAPAPAALRDHIVAAVTRVPPLGRRAMRMPLDLGRPIWVDAPESTSPIACTTRGCPSRVTSSSCALWWATS